MKETIFMISLQLQVYRLSTLEYMRQMFILCDCLLIIYLSFFCLNYKLTILWHWLYQCVNHFRSLIVPYLL